MYLASRVGIAWRTAEFSPEYPARGTARALDEANTVAPIAAVTAQKAMTDPFSRIVTSHIQQCAPYRFAFKTGPQKGGAAGGAASCRPPAALPHVAAWTGAVIVMQR